jgi:hypothetical protein
MKIIMKLAKFTIEKDWWEVIDGWKKYGFCCSVIP